jgi:hypothetical protein
LSTTQALGVLWAWGMLHVFIFPHVQSLTNLVCNSVVILLWLMLQRDHFDTRFFFYQHRYIINYLIMSDMTDLVIWPFQAVKIFSKLKLRSHIFCLENGTDILPSKYKKGAPYSKAPRKTARIYTLSIAHGVRLHGCTDLKLRMI